MARSPQYTPNTIVRSRKDRAIGRVVRSHRDTPQDPLQVLVRWRDGTAMWHAPATLELVMQAAPKLEDMFDDVEGEVMPEVESQKQYVGRRLAKMRELQGLSQRKFAAKVGIRSDRVADIETGRSELTMTMFIHLCRALNVEPSTFLELGIDKTK